MNKVTTLSRYWLKFIAPAFCWLASILSLQAQAPATGTIQGRVFNPVSKEYVRNAEVRLDGTQQVAFTENDGSFQFLNVPAGPGGISTTENRCVSAKERFQG